jgi:hypothetical protein
MLKRTIVSLFASTAMALPALIIAVAAARGIIAV